MVVSSRNSPWNERESAASASHGHPGHFTLPSAAHLAGITRKGERGLSGSLRRCQTDDTHLARLSRSRYPRFPPPTSCMRIRPLTTPPTPTGRAAATKPTRHELHEVRPGALTRPRRLCPTSDGTPKQPPVSLAASGRRPTHLPPPGPETRLWLGDDSAVFEDVFCPCGIALRPAFIGWRGQGEESKTSPSWQCDTDGKTWLGRLLDRCGYGSGCRFWRGLPRRQRVSTTGSAACGGF